MDTVKGEEARSTAPHDSRDHCRCDEKSPVRQACAGTFSSLRADFNWFSSAYAGLLLAPSGVLGEVSTKGLTLQRR